MSDSISREAVLKLFATHDGKYLYEAIRDMPAEQPEIIRCKECKYYEWTSNRVPDEQTWFCHNWNAETGKDDFCSRAERRQDAIN